MSCDAAQTQEVRQAAELPPHWPRSPLRSPSRPEREHDHARHGRRAPATPWRAGSIGLNGVEVEDKHLGESPRLVRGTFRISWRTARSIINSQPSSARWTPYVRNSGWRGGSAPTARCSACWWTFSPRKDGVPWQSVPRAPARVFDRPCGRADAQDQDSTAARRTTCVRAARSWQRAAWGTLDLVSSGCPAAA